jgi:hypothetical protein
MITQLPPLCGFAEGFAFQGLAPLAIDCRRSATEIGGVLS